MSGPVEVTVLLGDPSLPDAAKPGGVFTAEDRDAVVRLREALDGLSGYRFVFEDDHEGLAGRLAADPPGLVLNFCDTGWRNDARRELHVPALLELLGVPYSGAGPTALGMCYDKATVRAVAAAHGVPVPGERFVPASGPLPDLDGAPLPAFVKPATGDGSEGIDEGSLVTEGDGLRARIDALRDRLPGRDLLVQEFLPGEEYAVGLVGNPGTGLEALPLLRVDYSGLDPSLPRLLSYGSKTDPDSPYWTDVAYREADPPAEVRDVLLRSSELLFGRLGCRDYARFDFRADADGQPRLLEANPNPAWCWDGKMNLMAGFAGWSYRDFLAALLGAVRRRLDASPARS